MRVYKSLVSKHFTGSVSLGEVLLKMTNLPLTVIEEAATKGAVWVQKGRGKTLRERSLLKKLAPQDTVSFFYGPKILSLPAMTEGECLFENQHYGIWVKPAGVVSQGSQTGDHASLLRCIEIVKGKEIFLVHRLDRETAGIMVFAYSSEAAAKLGELFQKNLIKKEYEAVVLGERPVGERSTINISLDDKKAVTHYEVLNSTRNRSLLKIQIETGRLHQIRRHLDQINHPVIGDPKYGQGNKNKEGLKLLARTLGFQDPWDKQSRTWVITQGLNL